ncbi:hypothetical protein PRNP1_009141 [Phytophthora ramorum]
MDDMAKMLESYTGGLQQSFESVFERVGQSLSQSAQVMRMMNDVMESAMLQNLLISSGFNGARGQLVIEVQNHSQIMLGPTKISARLGNEEASFFSMTVESFSAGQRVQVDAPVPNVVGPIAGFIELECISPGTQQPLTKRSPFRVFYFQKGSFQAVRRGEEGAVPGPSEVVVASDRFLLTRVRELLDLSPIQGILTEEQGRYRFVPALQPSNGTVFYLSVKETSGVGGPAFLVSVSANGNASTSELRTRCQEIIDEMEIDSDDSDY